MKIPRNAEEAVSAELGLPMIFIHTPKCGGSFVGATFEKRWRQCPSLVWPEAAGHKTYQEYEEIFEKRGDSLQNYVLFTVIRNPWDWHLSWYNYVSKDEGGRRSGLALEHEQIKDLTFDDYVRWVDAEHLPKSENDYMRRQVSDWIIDGDGHVAVDNILRQETLEADVKSLQHKYGLLFEIPHGERINASRGDADYRLAYTDQAAERIAKRHARDIALFGYTFD